MRKSRLVLISCITVFILVMKIISPTLNFAEEKEYVTTKLEAEDNIGKFALGENEEASGGKYIGIDYTLNGEGFYNYYLVYENVPETTTLSINYASPHGGELIIYIEKDGKQEVLGSLLYDATGGWDPFGTTLGQVLEKIYIPEGSKITFITTSTFNVDYFEFMFNETERPTQSDGRQPDGVAEKNNVFLSDLNYIRATRVEKDLTNTLSSLSIAGNIYEKGLSMSSGHYPGSEFVEINIEGLGFTTFASYIGVDDSTNVNFGFGRDTSVKFYVEVDGELKAESDVLTFGGDPVLITVDITNAKTLKLYTSPVDDGVGTDICVWGNAALGKSTDIKEIFATPVPTPSPTPQPTTEATPNKTDSSTTTKGKDNKSVVLYVAIAVSIVIVIAIGVLITLKIKKNSIKKGD